VIYKTPNSFDKALTARAKNAARNLGLPVTHVRRMYAFDRLAARVFRADPRGWILKGGQALLVRYEGQARLSRDIDLQRADSDDLNGARAALRQAAKMDLGDYFTFSLARSEQHASGAKDVFQALLGGRAYTTVSVDLVVGLSTSQPPQEARLKPLIDISWPDDWPMVRLYPLVDHIADKVCAMYTWHNDTASSRHRDLADILLISQRDTVDAAAALAALEHQRTRRRARGEDLRLPERFEVPHPSWRGHYPNQAAEVSGLQGCATLDDATAMAAPFLTPLLEGTCQGTWHPQERKWSG
jgi:hypothetical protein